MHRLGRGRGAVLVCLCQRVKTVGVAPTDLQQCWINRCTRQCYRCVQHLYEPVPVSVRGDAWLVLLSPCNTYMCCPPYITGPDPGISARLMHVACMAHMHLTTSSRGSADQGPLRAAGTCGSGDVYPGEVANDAPQHAVASVRSAAIACMVGICKCKCK